MMGATSTPLRVSFSGVARGGWRVTQSVPVSGERLPDASYVAISEGQAAPAGGALWTLSGVTRNLRYTTTDEKSRLASMSAPLGRAEATRAALIPIRKSAAWWELGQDERRKIFEDRSRHIGIGMDYLPAVARRLHHCRDLAEPFDFLTWFEFRVSAESDFNHMVERLRATEEWRYVEREVDIRLIRTPSEGMPA